MNLAQKLLEFYNLKPNWDSYGSPAISQKALKLAYQIFVHNFCQEVYPVPGGGVQFEWTWGEKFLEIEIQPNGKMEYLFGNSIFDSWYEGEIMPSAVNLLLRKLKPIDKSS
jgi:hypothetical protein